MELLGTPKDILQVCNVTHRAKAEKICLLGRPRGNPYLHLKLSFQHSILRARLNFRGGVKIDFLFGLFIIVGTNQVFRIVSTFQGVLMSQLGCQRENMLEILIVVGYPAQSVWYSKWPRLGRLRGPQIPLSSFSSLLFSYFIQLLFHYFICISLELSNTIPGTPIFVPCLCFWCALVEKSIRYLSVLANQKVRRKRTIKFGTKVFSCQLFWF